MYAIRSYYATASAATTRRAANPAPHQRAVRLRVTELPTEIVVLFRKA